MLLGADDSERCSVDSVTETVRAYLSDHMPSRESSPLQWWKMNSSQYNLLVPLVKTYLSVPATSTPSERIFSCGRLIANHLRSSLNPEHLNMLVFLNKNYKLDSMIDPIGWIYDHTYVILTKLSNCMYSKLHYHCCV